jgi:hypothetical protein
MNLTQDYSVIAAFDSPVEVTPFTEKDLPSGPYHDYTQGFVVGPFEYIVNIYKDPLSFLHDMYHVEFYLQRIRKKGQELFEMLRKHSVHITSVSEAERVNAKGLYAFHITKTGNSLRVLGNVVTIIKDFINKYPVDCITFDSYENPRTDLYNNMVSKLFPNADVHSEFVSGHTEFTVCRNLKGELGKEIS